MTSTTTHSAATDAAPFNFDPAQVLDRSSALPPLTFNPDDYAQYVTDFDLSPAQQRELLEALWAVVVAFVDLGFDQHPVQQAIAKAHPELVEAGFDAADDHPAFDAEREAS